MSRDRDEHLWRRGLRRLRLLELAGLAVLLAALSSLVLAAPSLRLPYRLAALGILVLWTLVPLLLRHRYRAALGEELARQKLAEQTARAADQAKSRLLARVGHEIRAPLHGVLGMTDLLLRSELTPEQREQADLAKTSAEFLLTLAEDVLDLSRIDAERVRLRPRDFRLRDLTGEVVRLLAPRAVQREVDLRLRVDPALPEALHGDPVRLRQVLLNLVGNAVRFTRRGSVTVTVEPAEGDGTEVPVRFEVHDTGVGIRPEDQARLFEPFAQVGSSSSGVLSGSGLGLAISRSLVELMGGEIGFESTRGVGSTFWFRLPLERATGSGSASSSPSKEADATARRLARGHHRVLVVDDRSLNRSVGLALLSELGFAAEAAAGGEEALAMLADGRFDAVLLDCEMPGLDGFETCRRLRRQEAEGGMGRRLPVIAVTGHGRTEDVHRCLAAGMDDHLTKPFGAADLAAALDPRLGIEATAPTGDDLAARLAALRHQDETTGESTVAAFLRQGKDDLATLRCALPEADAESVATASHALAGSAGILGATDLAERAAEVATLARRGDLGGCSDRLQDLERAWRETVERLQP